MEEEINFRCKGCRIMLTYNRAYINTKIKCICKEENIVPSVSEKPISPLRKNKGLWGNLHISYINHLHYMLPIHNAPSILEKGIFCHSVVEREEMAHEDFSDSEVQNRRDKFIPGTTKRLPDFVPLYFETHTPMQYSFD